MLETGQTSPSSSRTDGQEPRGIDVLLKKASVDAAFRAQLLRHRSLAAEQIGLELQPAEAQLLNTIPLQQLAETIKRTRVEPAQRRSFLGKAAAVMLAALGVTSCGQQGEVNQDASQRAEIAELKAEADSLEAQIHRQEAEIDAEAFSHECNDNTESMREEIEELRKKIRSLESAEMAPSTDGEAKSLKGVKKTGTVIIAGCAVMPTL